MNLAEAIETNDNLIYQVEQLTKSLGTLTARKEFSAYTFDDIVKAINACGKQVITNLQTASEV